MKYLLDTSVLSETRKPKPELKVLRWIEEREETALFISALTLGEIHSGIVRLPDGARRDALQNWVDRDLAGRFHGRILPVDAEVASEWGRLAGRSAAQGRALPVIDGLIAATAVTHHLTVVTRNVKDIEGCGAPVLDPWD